MSQSSTVDMPPTFSDQAAAPILGDEAQRLISCNQKLQELGIDDTIKLPRIVVIGDQSTGKSSLIEAISTIKVPKDTNLCTKCPIAINLTNGSTPSSPWRCTVRIEEKYSFNTRQKKVSKANPLGPWQLQKDTKVTTIRTTEDAKELCALIDVAQRLLLNPSRDRGSLVDIEVPSDKLEKFSPNTIRVDISAGEWPNLSFIDLPGVIQTPGRGQPEYYVDVVTSLARTYAKDDNNVIMLTLPINHDVSNSKSYSIIQQENAQSRAIAIFTKVDLAREEERRDCLDKYFGDEAEEEFEYGHQMVMLASGPGLEIETEDMFFSKQPWSRLPQAVQQRLGVRNLTGLLRRILFQKTSETLPGNLQKIQVRLGEVRDKLDAMPEPPDALELPYQLREQIHVFEGNIKQLFTSSQDTTATSSSSRNKLVQSMQRFGSRISKGKPTMLRKTDAESEKLSRAERSLREGSSVDPVSIDTDSESGRPAMTSFLPKQSPRKANKADTRVQCFRLEEIRHMNHERYQSSVPGEIEPTAVEQMHRMSIQYWGITFKEFMSEVSKLVHKEVLQCVLNTFGNQRHLALYAQVEALTREYLDDVVQSEWTHLDRLCDAEQKHPLTFNTDSVKESEMESLTQLREKRAEARLKIARAIQKSQNAGKKKVKEVTLEDLGPDPWDVEVKMAAKTKAYYDVASHRFVDSVCQQVFAHLVPRCQGALVQYIKQHLGLNDIPRNRTRIVALMSEDAAREAYRAQMISEMERLNEGHAYIASVLGTVNGPRISDGTAGDSIYADAIMSDENVASPTNISPSKRKAAIEQDDVEAESPTKRNQVRHGAAVREHTPLVNRSRSFEPEE
ncbi:hypothetical protein PMZ80_000912 [Knufia obscura]|uniref:Dynamin family protein n=2 Tax=Knufia TaxID=430999 RepID=A0AAN8EA33_9EURO|nr:hypothetical protein PMZ80_000912 [Knufia obscura]KAK5950294.1 hypothetical protein OHC33_008763 [Knufia fluminis]